MAKSTKSHREKKNSSSHAAWKVQNKEDNVNHAPYVKEMLCLRGCGFSTHDKRKARNHVSSCPKENV